MLSNNTLGAARASCGSCLTAVLVGVPEVVMHGACPCFCEAVLSEGCGDCISCNVVA